MIITECPYCDEVHLVPFQIEFCGQFRKLECDKCHKTMFVEMSTIDGTTYSKEEFIKKGGNYND